MLHVVFVPPTPSPDGTLDGTLAPTLTAKRSTQGTLLPVQMHGCGKRLRMVMGLRMLGGVVMVIVVMVT